MEYNIRLIVQLWSQLSTLQPYVIRTKQYSLLYYAEWVKHPPAKNVYRRDWEGDIHTQIREKKGKLD